MVSKSKSMIVLVAGLPGSGKSYFASRLAEHLHAIYIGSDEVRKSLDAFGKYSLPDKLAIYEVMADLAAENLEKGETVIIDATFYLKNMRRLFFALADKHSSELYLIHVEAKEELIRERVSKPRPDSEADFEVYKKIKGEYEPIDSPHLTLQSTNSNITQMINQAMQYIGKQS